MNTERQRQARITSQEVQEAIEQLQGQGVDNPSIRQIYAALGYRGSFSKITEFKKQMLSKEDNTVTLLDNKLDNVLDNSLPSSVIKLDNDLDNIEAQLWEKIEIRLEQWWLKKNNEGNSSEIIETLQAENLALQEQVEQLKAVVKEMQSKNESLCQQVEVLKSEPVQSTESVSDPILNQYRTLIQQKRTEIEDSQILQNPDWRTKKARWPKLVDFVLELEQVEPQRTNELST